MKYASKLQLAALVLSLLTMVGLNQALAATASYSVTTTWFEPDTQPNDTIFLGTFDYDSVTRTVTNLQGILSESMTGDGVGYPNDSMTWLTLGYQLSSWYDTVLGGTFAATFKNNNTNTFWTGLGGDGWTPGDGVEAGGVYYGFPKTVKNPGNAYALIFIPDDPLQALTQTQINYLAYADCAPGGMMGAVCMTGTSESAYGSIGTMSGYPVSQVITAVAAVPEPESYAMMLLGLAMMGVIARRRQRR
jgi:hypothetical protein